MFLNTFYVIIAAHFTTRVDSPLALTGNITMSVGYACDSTSDQTLDLQQEVLKKQVASELLLIKPVGIKPIAKD